jgi:hypothetical protein
MILGYYPSFEDTYRSAIKFVEEHQNIARSEVIAVTEQGREVIAIHITDPKIPLNEKQVFLAVYGRHGNELGTRVAGLTLLDWLSQEEALDIRRKQNVIVLPVANPDGSAENKFGAPRNGLSELEETIIDFLVETYKPDAVVDIHSLGDAYLEAIIDGHTDSWAEDDMIHRRLAMKVSKDAVLAGHNLISTDYLKIKQLLAQARSGYNNFLCEAFYEKNHSLVFGLELCHFNLTPEHVKNVNEICLSSLLKAGNQKLPWQKNPSYPNQILVGDLSTSIRVKGENPGERRKSRHEVWKNRENIKILKTIIKEVKGSETDIKEINTTTKYSGEETISGFELIARFPRQTRIQKVSVNGEKVRDFSTFNESDSNYLVVPIRTVTKGEYTITITTSSFWEKL